MAWGDGTYGYGYAEDPAMLAAEAEYDAALPDWVIAEGEAAEDAAEARSLEYDERMTRDDRDPRGPNPCICPERRDQCPFWEGPCPYAA